MAGVTGGQGGITGGAATAQGQSGDVRSGNRTYGGINIGSAGGSLPFNMNTVYIIAGVTALYLIAKKKNFI